MTLDDLENRQLLSQGVQPIFTLSSATTSDIISGPDGDLWVGVVDPTSTPPEPAIDRIGLNGSVTTFPLPTNGANTFWISSVTTGPDGNVWFDAEYAPPDGDNQVLIGNVTPTGVVTEFPAIPVSAGQNAEPITIVDGPDGDLWFGDEISDYTVQSTKSQNFIGRVTTAGAVTLFPISSYSSRTPVPIDSLAVGPDGNLWFTEGVGKRFVVGRMSPSGAVSTLPFPKVLWVSLANGPDGSLFASGPTNELERQVFNVSTAGAITRDKIPAAVSGGILNYLGTADGSLWFSDESRSLKIDRIAPTGVLTSFKFVARQNAYDESMAVGQDGNLYVLVDSFGKGENTPATVYRVTPSKLVPVR